MITVETVLGVAVVQVSRGTTVIIRDTFGNPVAFVIESSENVITIYTHEDEARFNSIAKALGIDKLAVCERLEIQEPTAFQNARRLVI